LVEFRQFRSQTVARMSLLAAFFLIGAIDGLGELKSDCQRRGRW
jgi:hypothetical protein